MSQFLSYNAAWVINSRIWVKRKLTRLLSDSVTTKHSSFTHRLLAFYLSLTVPAHRNVDNRQRKCTAGCYSGLRVLGAVYYYYNQQNKWINSMMKTRKPTYSTQTAVRSLGCHDDSQLAITAICQKYQKSGSWATTEPLTTNAFFGNSISLIPTTAAWLLF